MSPTIADQAAAVMAADMRIHGTVAITLLYQKASSTSCRLCRSQAARASAAAKRTPVRSICLGARSPLRRTRTISAAPNTTRAACDPNTEPVEMYGRKAISQPMSPAWSAKQKQQRSAAAASNAPLLRAPDR